MFRVLVCHLRAGNAGVECYLELLGHRPPVGGRDPAVYQRIVIQPAQDPSGGLVAVQHVESEVAQVDVVALDLVRLAVAHQPEHLQAEGPRVHGGQGEIGAQWLVLWQGELGGERLGGERADVADLAAGQVDRAGAAVKSQVTHGDPICGRRTERRAAPSGAGRGSPVARAVAAVPWGHRPARTAGAEHPHRVTVRQRRQPSPPM
jgi:hypothetical protein